MLYQRKNKKRLSFPFIKQAGYMECGTTCLAMIFKYYGYYDIRGFLSEKAQVNTEGIDLFTLNELAEGFGFNTDAYQLNYNELYSSVHLPCIAHYDGNHFVVVYKITPEHVWIADPAVGKHKLLKEDFATRWNGIVLVLEPSEDIFKHNELTELVEARRRKHKSVVKKFYLEPFLNSRKVLGKVLLATFCLQLLGLALPFFTQSIIDQVLVNENAKLLYAILVALIVVFSSQILLTYGRNLLLTHFKARFERSFFSNFFSHFIKLKQSYFDRHKREDFINRFQENLKIRKALNPSILEGIIDVLFIVTYLLVLYAYSGVLGLIATLFISLYIVLTVVFTPKLKNLENKVFSENTKNMGQFLDTLLGMQSVRLLGIERLKFTKWKNQYTKTLNKVLQTEKSYIGLSSFLSAINHIGRATIYWYGAFLTFKGLLSIGQYIAFITIFTIIINALSRISHLWFIFTELSVTFERLNDVYIEDTIDTSLEGKIKVKTPFNISFEDVSFKYHENQEHYVLKNISLQIKPGEFIGIVGRNGSGKSTLVKLLCNMYENYSGCIKINTVELKNIIPDQIRKKIAIIPQNVYLFDGTIKENILYGNTEATDEQIIEASMLAGAHDFIKAQYLGYNLKIGENGVNLSGGQRLKIAFARLFLSDADIIILDEASSALDVETESMIMKNLLCRFSKKTIISIAHRLNTLRNADRIMVLDKGELTESGSHDELISLDGVYSGFMKTYLQY